MYARRAAVGFGFMNLLWLVYFVAGVVVAADRKYFDRAENVERVVEAALAVLLWPLVLLGVDMRI
jgi:K+-transporting ATPase A subunit